ncbi:MAG TPA: sugar kinase [Spirochaetia bacterium]|nr:sugar kinase [Spirochaetia bacterium]
MNEEYKAPRTDKRSDTKKRAVFFGELLMRLDTKRFERFVQARQWDVYYTGGEANAAVSLANFGIGSTVVSAVPDNEIGQACINYIRQFGVDTDYILRQGNRLGILFVETGASQRPSRVIYDRSGSSFTEIKPGDLPWKQIFRDEHWFHFTGTAPALGKNAAEVVSEACMIAHRLGLTVSCDLNYRRKLWSAGNARSTMQALMKDVDVLIGNGMDAGLLLAPQENESGETDPDLLARDLLDRYSFKAVALTSRKAVSASENDWSGYLYDGKDAYRSKEYRIRMVDRIGGGDAFTGALIYGFLKGLDTQLCLDFAVAAACLKHSIHGDFNLVSVEEVMSLLSGEDPGRVQR